jgi:hypothetical protein
MPSKPFLKNHKSNKTNTRFESFESRVNNKFLELNAKINELQTEIKEQQRILVKLRGPEQIPDVLVNNLVITPVDEFIGRNWYPPEVNDEGVDFRWTGPGALATIKLPLLRVERLKALLNFFAADNAAKGNIRIFVDGDEISPLSSNDDQLKFIIPARKYISSFTEIGMLTTNTQQTKDESGQVIDSRWLGFVFTGLNISQ